jgi:hypothetical protein
MAITLAMFATPGLARANVVTDWNRTMVAALDAAPPTPPPPAARVAAIVQSAVFDAVNGIERRYTPVHVPPAAPRGASREAAAAGAAHEALVALFPAQQAMLDQRLADTIAEISEDGDGGGRSILLGLQWGKTVADDILAWRATDHFTDVLPPYVPAGIPGRWQPTPPLFGPPLFRQFAIMTPFAIKSADQFLPPPPPSLQSAQYAQDFNEVKALGSAASTIRTPDQTQAAMFWQSDTPAAIWNRLADDLAEQQGGSLLHTARTLALMNIALADTTIAIWNAKNYWDRWRPITAIQQADTITNPDTIPDPAWTPLLPTPAFQEYPAAHPGVSNSAATVLASFYGENTTFTVTAGLPGIDRSFTSFSSAVQEVENARVWGGIHFRFSCVTGAQMGTEVADYVIATQLLPADRDQNGETAS